MNEARSFQVKEIIDSVNPRSEISASQGLGTCLAKDRNEVVSRLIAYSEETGVHTSAVQSSIVMYEKLLGLIDMNRLRQICSLLICLHISSKAQRVPTCILEYLSCNFRISKEDLVQQELHISQQMNWNFKFPTISENIREIARAIDLNSEEIINISEQLSLLFYRDFYLRSYDLTEVAAVCLLHTCRRSEHEEKVRKFIEGYMNQESIRRTEEALNQALSN